MALIHYAYSFDVEEFMKSTSLLVESIDKSDLRLLYKAMTETIHNEFPGLQLLAEAGYRIPYEEEFTSLNFVGLPRSHPLGDYLDGVKPLPSEEIGYWLLTILARYLKKSSGIGANYSVLDMSLRNVGWSEVDREYLIAGLPCCLLIKPDCTRQSQRIESDPYWHWIVPSHAQSSGWLPYHEVARLKALLSRVEPKIRNYDGHLFPNPWGLLGQDLIDSQADWNNRLQSAFNRAMMMLNTALQVQTGVFMVMGH